MADMVSKGLAAAVLATIHLQRGWSFGECNKNITFSGISFSIVFTSILIPLLEKSESTRKVYCHAVNSSLWIRIMAQKYQRKRAEKATAMVARVKAVVEKKPNNADNEEESVNKL